MMPIVIKQVKQNQKAQATIGRYNTKGVPIKTISYNYGSLASAGILVDSHNLNGTLETFNQDKENKKNIKNLQINNPIYMPMPAY
jgi:hypothetical protein